MNEHPQLLTNSTRYNAANATALLGQLKATAWTCASINAAACATNYPNLYVTTRKSQPIPKAITQPTTKKTADRIRAQMKLTEGTAVDQITEHPILTLLATVNPYMNQFDLWEITTLYQETIGSAYWYLTFGPLGRPSQIWPLPAHQVVIQNEQESLRFQYNGQTYTEKQIIHFRYPDPSNPYGPGLSPLRASWNEVLMSSSYAELKLSKFQNRAMPDAIISPKEVIGPEERDRLELEWKQKFGRGGNGRALVAEAELQVQLLNQSMGDLAALAEKGKNSEDICNAFHVPLSMLSTNTNLANLQASQAQHAIIAIEPRLTRRDEKLNEQLIPLYDSTGRLKLASEDPTPKDTEENYRILDINAKYGILTINELREQQGLPPVSWGEQRCQPPSAPSASP